MFGTDNPQKPEPAPKHLDELLDEALDETFPASDPVAVRVERDPPAPDPHATGAAHGKPTPGAPPARPGT